VAQVSKPRLIAGWLLVCLVGAMMVFAGAGKAFGFAPPDIVEGLKKAGALHDQIQLIGAGAMVTGILLIFPYTFSLGVLLASSYWGGAIVTHMVQGESYALPAGLLLATWIGAFLKEPRVLCSFFAKPAAGT